MNAVALIPDYVRTTELWCPAERVVTAEPAVADRAGRWSGGQYQAERPRVCDAPNRVADGRRDRSMSAIGPLAAAGHACRRLGPRAAAGKYHRRHLNPLHGPGALDRFREPPLTLAFQLRNMLRGQPGFRGDRGGVPCCAAVKLTVPQPTCIRCARRWSRSVTITGSRTAPVSAHSRSMARLFACATRWSSRMSRGRRSPPSRKRWSASAT